MKKFTIKLSPLKYGWMTISIYVDNRLITNISGSGVYSPFYDIDVLFRHLRARKHYIWEIDQEGSIAKLKFKNLRNKLIVNIINDRRGIDLDETFTFSKKQFLNELKNKLNKFRKKEYKEINDKCYNFYYRKIN